MSLHEHSDHEGRPPDYHSARIGLVLVGFLIIGGALLFTEHRAHVLGILIWLPLLACLLMHMFMHGGHGGHGSHGSNEQRNREREAS